jgi:hypothetical protein
MSLEWGPATKASANKLAAAIRAVATEPRHYGLAERAAAGEFTDYAEIHICPIVELYKLCRQCGLHALAVRVQHGEFDAGKEESDEWANSPSGRAAFAQLSPGMRKQLGEKE